LIEFSLKCFKPSEKSKFWKKILCQMGGTLKVIRAAPLKFKGAGHLGKKS
jgi:hypothetical protein